MSSIEVGNYADHLALFRSEYMLTRGGGEVSQNTLCRWVMPNAAVLQIVYRAMVERARSSESILTDDTPVPVLDASLPKTRTARFGSTAASGGIRTRFTIARRL